MCFSGRTRSSDQTVWMVGFLLINCLIFCAAEKTHFVLSLSLSKARSSSGIQEIKNRRTILGGEEKLGLSLKLRRSHK
ncbi:hypothetical protein QJS04_geneDACA020513 [Acorus gramineus]|uniref:Secreted protein n=1 Tax=Acorus gramineus TaxID=55184 RepID=A0AAV9AD66_ACOGR|nr:hypothetical protein QJS04_geneDACA020513 [Acorus gramineus]